MYSVLIVDDDKLARKGLIAITDWAKCGMQVVGDVANGKLATTWVQNVDAILSEGTGNLSVERLSQLKDKLTSTRAYFAKVQELAPDRSDLWQNKLDNIDELISVVDRNLSEVAKRDKK